MALLWLEGFEGFGTGTGAAPSPVGVVNRKYPAVGLESSMSIQAGRLGGYALKLEYDTGCYLQSTALTTHSTLVVGFAMKVPAWYTNGVFFALYDGGTVGVTVRLATTGELAVYRGSTLLGTTSGAGLSTNTWFYLELKVVCGDSGSYELRINGQTVLSASGVDTKAGSNDYHDRFRLQGMITLSSYRNSFDDLYCLDGSGSANNDFLGPRRVVALLPNAAGDSSQFTPSASDNYACVDEQASDDDTTYVESSTSGQKDLYNFGSLSGITGGINGLQVNTMARETDVTSYTLKTLCKSGATESEDAGQLIGSTSYVVKRRLLEADPNTSAAWTVEGVDAAQFGVKI